ncbi:thermosome subunit [Halobellus sp. MBLA0160]|uniref:Thermosome subunit n=1 Tax=Halobellus ruber TaxID=2761102 RepID=A0A7J9SJ92_9EURY|nr:thermosome subunit [Halobellus ruber]
MFILDEDSERTAGRDAQQANIAAGKAIAEAVRTTLGPQGMDKMLVSDSGDVVITNDGATILSEMDIEHPAAQMLVDVADEQEAALGDGTTTAAILTGELLSAAEEFLDQDLHPRTIVEGYWEVERIAADAIDDCILDDDEFGEESLQQAVESAMTGKGTGSVAVDALAGTIIEAVERVDDDGTADRDAIAVEARTGRSASATEVVDGVLADADPVRDGMPERVDDATVAVIDGDLEQREPGVDTEYAISTDEQLSTAVAAEEETLVGYAESLATAGVDVAFVTGDIADRTASALASRGILAFEDVDGDAAAVAAATGASQVPGADEVEAGDPGSAGAIAVEAAGDDSVVRIEAGAGEPRATVVVRGSTEHALDEIERTVNDGIDVAVAAYNRREVVPGGGMVEVAVAERLREAAAGVEGRRQLAVEAAAEAFDAVPRALARSAGEDPIDTLVELRAANREGRAGLVIDGDVTVADPVEHGVLDPAAVKRESVRSAVEVATMILRIDDVISAD